MTDEDFDVLISIKISKTNVKKYRQTGTVRKLFSMKIPNMNIKYFKERNALNSSCFLGFKAHCTNLLHFLTQSINYISLQPTRKM